MILMRWWRGKWCSRWMTITSLIIHRRASLYSHWFTWCIPVWKKKKTITSKYIRQRIINSAPEHSDLASWDAHSMNVLSQGSQLIHLPIFTSFPIIFIISRSCQFPNNQRSHTNFPSSKWPYAAHVLTVPRELLKQVSLSSSVAVWPLFKHFFWLQFDSAFNLNRLAINCWA